MIRFALVFFFVTSCVTTASRTAAVEFQGTLPLRDAAIASALSEVGWKIEEVETGKADALETLVLRRSDGRGKARLLVLDERDGAPSIRVEADESMSNGNMFEMFFALRKAVGAPLKVGDPGVVYCVDHRPPHVVDATVEGVAATEARLRAGFGCWQFGSTRP